MKPLALDLCCGLGGWAEGLIAAGWDVVGVDIEERFRATYPDAFYCGDVRSLAAPWHISMHEVGDVFSLGIKGRQFSLVVASPPCQEFSRHDQPWTKKRNPPEPDTSIWEACVWIAEKCGAPLILENVRGAQKWMGTAKWHVGSYYLWGDVPALMPKLRMGPKVGPTPEGCIRSKSNRTGDSAGAVPARSKVPLELALHIGRVFHPGRGACRVSYTIHQGDAPWIESRDGNPVAMALFRRHYSYRRTRDQLRLFGNPNATLFVGPGEKLVLLTPCERALFVWRKFRSMDDQSGVNCAVFRNEGAGRSSELIRAAMDIAWARWPGERLYTYVNPRKVRSVNPGYCFLVAGWRKCGITKARRFLILEALPNA